MRLTKNIFSISLIGVVLIVHLWQTAITIHFYLNQSEIASKHCINIKSPELKCNGKCYLQSKIASTEDNRDNRPIAPNIASLFEFDAICQATPSLVEIQFINQLLSTEYQNLYQSLFKPVSTGPPKV